MADNTLTTTETSSTVPPATTDAPKTTGKGPLDFKLPAYSTVVFSAPNDMSVKSRNGRMSRAAANVAIPFPSIGLILRRTIWADVKVNEATSEVTETYSLSLRDRFTTDYVSAKHQQSIESWCHGLICEDGPFQTWQESTAARAIGVSSDAAKPRLVRKISASELEALRSLAATK